MQRRWTAPRDLADALEHLSVVALVRSAGEDADAARRRAVRVRAGRRGEPVAARRPLRPGPLGQDKARLVDDLLADKALPATTSLVKQALAGTYRTVGVALAEYQKVAAEAQDQGVATVRVARELPDADRARLGEALSRQYGRPIHLNVVVDPAVLGGIRVEIGDDVIDGTVSSRLDDARRAPRRLTALTTRLRRDTREKAPR